MANARDYVIENLSILTASGMSISEALDGIQKEVKSRRMRRIVKNIKEKLESGLTLWNAMKQSRIFPEYAISLIKIGEESGQLRENLKVVALQGEKDGIFRSKIYSAMMYPVFVLFLTLVVGISIAWFILPRLALVFSGLKLKLPFITRGLIIAGGFLRTYGSLAVPIFIFAFVLFVYIFFFFSKTKFIGQWFLFRFPGIANLIKELELARFGYLFGTLLKVNLPITQVIKSLWHASDCRPYRNFYKYLEFAVDDGNSFQKSFALYKKTNKLIPVPVQQLIISGEHSGNLAEAFIKIGSYFESKTETTSKNLTVILEPILLVIVWLGVVAVALAVILPIYNLIGGLNQGNNFSSSEIMPEPLPELSSEPLSELLVEQSALIASSSLNLIPTQTLKILQTELTYLNVRNLPSLEGVLIGKVFPGEIYTYKQEKDGWYNIILSDETTGWVFGKYVEILK